MSVLRVAILTGGSGSTAAMALPALTGSDRIEVTGVVLAKGMNPLTERRRKIRRLRKALRIGALGTANGFRMRAWFHNPTRPLQDVCAELGVPLLEVPYLGSAETAGAFTRLAPQLGLSLGNTFIPERIFSLPEYGMLNLHGERLPEYQNAQSVIWPIYNMETQTGFAIHEITAAIDAGDILYQEAWPIVFADTLRGTLDRTLPETRRRAVRGLVHVCEEFFRLRDAKTPQRGGRSYTTPSIWQFARMAQNNRKLWREQEKRSAT